MGSYTAQGDPGAMHAMGVSQWCREERDRYLVELTQMSVLPDHGQVAKWRCRQCQFEIHQSKEWDIANGDEDE